MIEEDPFWDDLNDDDEIGISQKILDWLGVDQARFEAHLDWYMIPYMLYHHNELERFPDLVKEAEEMDLVSLAKKRWVILSVDNFKQAAMTTHTPVGLKIKKRANILKKRNKRYEQYLQLFHREFRDDDKVMVI